MDKDQLQQILTEQLSADPVLLRTDGVHFEAIIVSEQFKQLNRIQRQRLVNNLLNPYLASGELHAFSMKTLTPEEWAQKKGEYQHG